MFFLTAGTREILTESQVLLAAYDVAIHIH